MLLYNFLRNTTVKVTKTKNILLYFKEQIQKERTLIPFTVKEFSFRLDFDFKCLHIMKANIA